MGLKVVPQLSNTVGNVGAVFVAAGQETVDPVFAGIVKSSRVTV